MVGGRRRENLHHFGALLGPALVEQPDQGQRGLLFDQIGAQRFSDRLLVAEDVEQVVDNLEGDPQLASESRQGLPLGLAGAGVVRAPISQQQAQSEAVLSAMISR